MFETLKPVLEKELAEIKAAGLYKSERVITTPQGADIATDQGAEVINFCANNYLGLSSHPLVLDAAKKEGFTYMDVDYQGNANLLREAQKSAVKSFLYVSAINGDKMRHLKIFEAKERFVDELKVSGLNYKVIRPNGFFSDMGDFLDMAKQGKVYLFGDGKFKLNPIDGEDLAKVCVDQMDSSEKEITVGGPDVLTQNEIASLALNAFNKEVKIVHLPDWIRKFAIWTLRTFTSPKTYGPFEFFLTAMAFDNIAPQYGMHTLAKFFSNEVKQKHE